MCLVNSSYFHRFSVYPNDSISLVYVRPHMLQQSYVFRYKLIFDYLRTPCFYTFFNVLFLFSENREVNEQKIKKGHYFFENLRNMSTIIVFFGTARKPKFSEIVLLLLVFDHFPPPGFGGHVSKTGRRNKHRKDNVFDEFRVCGIFGYSKCVIILDGFYVFVACSSAS